MLWPTLLITLSVEAEISRTFNVRITSVWYVNWSTLQRVLEQAVNYLTRYNKVTIELTMAYGHSVVKLHRISFLIYPLAPNDIYIYIYICMSYRTLNSRRCILNIYSTNILTEYFKHAAHSSSSLSLSLSLSSRCRLFHNAIFFGVCNIHILNTECAKILKKIPAPKG